MDVGGGKGEDGVLESGGSKAEEVEGAKKMEEFSFPSLYADLS